MTVLPEWWGSGVMSRSDSHRRISVGLLVHRQVGEIVRMDKDVRIGFVVVPAAFEEGEVLPGDVVKTSARPVGVERGEAAHPDQHGAPAASRPDVEEDLIVVAQQGEQPTAPAQADEEVEDAPAVRPPVDVVAQGDHDVLGIGLDRVDQGSQRQRAAVNVADSNRAMRHNDPAGREFSDHVPGMTDWVCARSWIQLGLVFRTISPGPSSIRPPGDSSSPPRHRWTCRIPAGGPS